MISKAYFATLSVLIFHQIDAAYWKEWEMFNLPGGIQGFLVFNIIAVSVLLNGFMHVISNTARAKMYSYLCAGLGIITFLIHCGFVITGYDQFSLPLSMVIIGLCFIFGLWLVFEARRFTANERLSNN